MKEPINFNDRPVVKLEQPLICPLTHKVSVAERLNGLGMRALRRPSRKARNAKDLPRLMTALLAPFQSGGNDFGELAEGSQAFLASVLVENGGNERLP